LASFLVLLLVPPVATAAPLLPDLKPLGSGAIRLCKEKSTALFHKDACTGTGRTVIRTTTKTGDSGKGPLELAAVPHAQDIPEDCHGDGDVDINGDGIPDDNDVLVAQRVFNDANGDGVFKRSIDTSATSSIVGCRYYHAIHHHYHLEAFASFELVNAQTGQLVRGSDKVSFCINDTGSFDLSLPGAQQPSSSGLGYYSYLDCAPRDSVQGVSIGWADTYGWKTPGQEIDVTGLPAGDYCVVTQTDPDNHLAESNEGNNVRRVRFHIDPAKAPANSSLALKQVPGGCPSSAAASNQLTSAVPADRRLTDLQWSSAAGAASVTDDFRPYYCHLGVTPRRTSSTGAAEVVAG
jgi:lysyl oxidase